jgi:hypothetical protein
MLKTAINNGTPISPEWFRAIQTPSFSRAENEVGHLPLPDGYADLQQWMTFNPSASALDVSGWTRNAIVLPTVWLDSMSYSGITIKDAIMIVAPKWAAAGEATPSCTFAQTDGPTCPILRGNVLLVQFGSDGKISAYFSLPASDVDSIAQFKNIAGKLVTADLVVTTGNKQTADPTSADDIVGGVGGAGGESDSGAWWHFSGRGLFLKFFYTANSSALFKLFRGVAGWVMSGLSSLSTDALTVASSLTIPSGSIGAPAIASSAVTEGKIADGAVSLIKLSVAAKLQWRQCFSFSSSVLTPSGITSAYVACPRTLIEGFSLRIVVRSDTWSTSLQVVSIVIGGQTFTNLTSGWTYSDDCYILDNVPITSPMCVDFIDISINTANFATGQLVMSVQQYI